jgi:tetratricopeptide (TPR) repeat protein
MAQGDAAGGSGVSTLKADELEKSREYYLQTLQDVGTKDETALERGRALHSLAHIERKMGMADKAASHFVDAAGDFVSLLEREETPADQLTDVHLRLADCHENLGALAENPIGAEALSALEKAVVQFEKALLLDPTNEETVSRQAGTSFLLGRAYDAHQAYDRAIAAYSRSAELATELRELSTEPSDSLTELIGKLQFNAAISLEKLGKTDDAIDAHIAAMETLEKLRSVNGFTPLQSIQLASSYLQLGQLFAKKEATAEDQDQLFNESLRLLTPLNTADPSDIEVAILLCQSLVHLGELERFDNRWSEGYKLSVRGIEALKDALELSETPHVRGLCVLAEMRLEHLAFLEAEEKASQNVVKRGVETAQQIQKALAGEIIEEADFLEEPLRSQFHRRLVRIFGAYAEACDKLGEVELAQLCRKQAALQLAQAGPSEPLSIDQ